MREGRWCFGRDAASKICQTWIAIGSARGYNEGNNVRGPGIHEPNRGCVWSIGLRGIDASERGGLGGYIRIEPGEKGLVGIKFSIKSVNRA